MNQHVKSAVGAAAIAALVGMLLLLPFGAPFALVYIVLTLPAQPLMFLVLMMGLTSGPEGMPGPRETVIVVFLVWWAILDGSWRWLERKLS